MRLIQVIFYQTLLTLDWANNRSLVRCDYRCLIGSRTEYLETPPVSNMQKLPFDFSLWPQVLMVFRCRVFVEYAHNLCTHALGTLNPSSRNHFVPPCRPTLQVTDRLPDAPGTSTPRHSKRNKRSNCKHFCWSPAPIAIIFFGKRPTRQRNKDVGSASRNYAKTQVAELAVLKYKKNTSRNMNLFILGIRYFGT